VNVTLTPKFCFGVNKDIPDNVHLVDDDRKLLYVAGHNVIVYSLDEKTQNFIQGAELMESISAIAVAPIVNHVRPPLVAICEKGAKSTKQKGSYDRYAQCRILNYNTRDVIREIVPLELDPEFKSLEFLGVTFCPRQPERYVLTLAGQPEWCV
jgi:hypothetical protein